MLPMVGLITGGYHGYLISVMALCRGFTLQFRALALLSFAFRNEVRFTSFT